MTKVVRSKLIPPYFFEPILHIQKMYSLCTHYVRMYVCMYVMYALWVRPWVRSPVGSVLRPRPQREATDVHRRGGPCLQPPPAPRGGPFPNTVMTATSFGGRQVGRGRLLAARVGMCPRRATVVWEGEGSTLSPEPDRNIFFIG